MHYHAPPCKNVDRTIFVSRHSQSLLSCSLFTQLVNHRKGKHSPLVLKRNRIIRKQKQTAVMMFSDRFGHTPFFPLPLPDNKKGKVLTKMTFRLTNKRSADVLFLSAVSELKVLTQNNKNLCDVSIRARSVVLFR